MRVLERLFGKAEQDADRESVRKGRKRQILYILLMAAALLILTCYSVTISSTTITPVQVYETFINQIFPGTFDVPSKTQEIVMNVYAPRVLMAVFVGGIFAIGGCIVQTILKNPLATPYTLGVSSSAAFGAGLSIILGMTAAVGNFGTILNAFIFSLIPAAIILITSAKRSITTTTMILIGISISYLFSAANTIMQYFGEADAVKAALFWSVGDLNGAMFEQLPYVAATLLFTLAASFYLMKDIDIMRMGDDTATSLGVNVKAVRTASIILACLSTAVAVSFVGAIGFVCLLAPQISRIFVGNNMRYLLPASLVTGATLLVIADIIAKDLVNPLMLPVGAITALVGAPILIYLLIRNNDRMVV
ncbi:MAG: iron ABC transporter permease [Candidatus Methanoplasma sp.]|jgi:iron complex transport system permease protein|nr:iron ABC transporter permease [Candidatus Methanoplasma sp.]